MRRIAEDARPLVQRTFSRRSFLWKRSNRAPFLANSVDDDLLKFPLLDLASIPDARRRAPPGLPRIGEAKADGFGDVDAPGESQPSGTVGTIKEKELVKDTLTSKGPICIARAAVGCPRKPIRLMASAKEPGRAMKLRTPSL
eukprot:CAMPEP_0197635236 /NCGR_PEP_ID=MMETSP1338-20131121/11105_1 /TAXON_ID=43686 ORGANISM="Pelagodinium beii, Strain RCC1491" /NCGR_SAMPLE_ID=MMETSP1338 /ASSEMBLY_ACC=CAM_ASM_000754 /LENGTH=141 /DNA_ID=CAMNT_0043207249 /DNA_START=24 /DNA_END=449 /DNA_ORIENTATION=-